MRTIAVAILALALTGSAAASPVVKTAFNAKLKQTTLVDGRGHTLSMWTPDTGGRPVCVNDSTYHCDKHWVPLYGTAAAAQGGAKQSFISAVVRPDGKSQITYHTWPLSTWAGGYGWHADTKPGDIFGQGYAGLWDVLTPVGKVIHKMP
jgi:predicted lipoprotein with Yx(FWY)xxD motif